MLITSLPDPAVAEVAVALAVVVPMLAAAAVPTSRDGLRAAALAGWSGASVALAGSVALVAAGALDAVRGTLLVFAAGLAAVAIGFSARHLDGDLRAGRYRRRLLVTSAAAVTTLVVSDVAVLAVAWGLAGWGLTGLVGHHDDLPASGPAVAAMRRTLRAGDVALLVSLAVLVLGAGTTSVTGIAVWAASAPAGVMSVVGAGLLVATAARSAQWPFCRWLPLSVVAPAPVSALLHAGIANAPVVVLLGLFPVWRTIGWFAPALAVLGLGTAVVTFVRLLVRADVKTRLAWSTTAQLGFMLALLAVGAHAAAVIHLMLHGLYKANAFLRAGEDISLARRDRPLPATHRTRVGGAVAGAVAGLGILATDGAWNHPLTAAATLVAATAGGYGLWSLRARPAVRALAVLIAAGTLGVVLGGARVVGGLWALPADPAVEADGAAAWTAAAVVCALGLVGAVLRTRRPVPVWAVLHRASDPSLGLLDVLRLRIARRTAGTAGRATPAPAGAGPAAADEVVELVALAAEGLPPTWSWQGSVAANPLWGSRSMPFADALAESLRVQGPGAAAHRSRAEAAVDEAVAGWLAVWTAPDGPAWPAPSRDLDLWLWFRTVAVRDPLLAGIGARGGASVRELPDRAVDLVARAVADAVAAGWPDGRVWVADELGRLVGWAAYVARRNTAAAAVDVDALVALLAVRVATRRALTGSLVPRAQADGADLPTRRAGTAQERSVAVVAALEAAESQVRAPLVAALTSALDGATTDAPAAAEERPEADLVLCIDVRSERLRRHLESQGRYRTVGFAGFFGLPLTRRAGDGRSTSRLPALLAPTLRIDATAPDASVGDLLRGALREALDAPGGGFAAVELAGLRAVTGIAAAVHPRSRSRAPEPRATADVAQQDLPLAIQAVVATARAAGIGPGSARIVVLVGHGSTSTNNTAESSYDCGACGGYRGGANASVAAALLNGPRGRQALADAGLPLPDDTVVVAAEHDTATDEITLAPVEDVPPGHRAEYQRLVAALRSAAAQVAVERCRYLPGATPVATTAERRAVSEVRRRAADPAQVRHEWGLAGNAFFVAAPRGLTQGLDLDGRAFLHDYDETSDVDGSLLETILTAPAVVAHWINAQYVFSGLDPARWGAGSKTAHNPVGRLGVLCGAGGDLRVGLTEQAVHHRGAPPFPLARLLVVVSAAPERIDAVLARHPDLAALVSGDWLTLWAVRRADGQILQRARDGWHPPQVAGSASGTPCGTAPGADDPDGSRPAAVVLPEPAPEDHSGRSRDPDLGPGRRLTPVP